jgi:alpha-amylase
MLLDVYVDDQPDATEFSLIEDDGYSRDLGLRRLTRIQQKSVDLTTSIKILGASGRYEGALNDRAWTVRVWSPGWQVEGVVVDGNSLTACPESASSRRLACFKTLGTSAVIIELPAQAVLKDRAMTVRWAELTSQPSASLHFVCDEGRDAPRGHGIYVSGDHPALGQWNPSLAVALKPAEFARGVWTKLISGLTPGANVAWKCLRKLPGGGDSDVEWQQGSNNEVKLSDDGGFSGVAASRW